MIFKALKPFLHANTIAKIKFIKDKEMTEMLQKYIPLENLPEEYGGKDTEFAAIVGDT